MNYNNFLKEDIGRRDLTTQLIIPKDKIIKAVLLAKEPCVVCGMASARLVFKAQDSKIKFYPKVSDGNLVKKGAILAGIEGRAGSILTAERVALNFLSLLSGVATQTRRFVEAVRPYKVKIMDTRKTIPGLRELEKYAVRVGGGYNHRMRLDEMVLIKDNHLKVINPKSDGKVTLRLLRPFGARNDKCGVFQRYQIPKSIRGAIEVKNLKEFKEALKLKPDIIMLDNMSIKMMEDAVSLRNRLSTINYQPSTKLEASGGISLKNVRKIAATGVEMISVGALTHSVKSIDMSLEVL